MTEKVDNDPLLQIFWDTQIREAWLGHQVMKGAMTALEAYNYLDNYYNHPEAA